MQRQILFSEHHETHPDCYREFCLKFRPHRIILNINLNLNDLPCENTNSDTIHNNDQRYESETLFQYKIRVRHSIEKGENCNI